MVNLLTSGCPRLAEAWASGPSNQGMETMETSERGGFAPSWGRVRRWERRAARGDRDGLRRADDGDKGRALQPHKRSLPRPAWCGELRPLRLGRRDLRRRAPRRLFQGGASYADG